MEYKVMAKNYQKKWIVYKIAGNLFEARIIKMIIEDWGYKSKITKSA